MLGQKPHQIQIGCQLIENIIHDKDHLILKILNLRMLLQCQIGSLKYLACLVGDQVIADIVFIFEIKIKRSFGNTCIFYNICNGSFIESIVYKKRESGIQQGFPFLLFVVIDFSHTGISPLPVVTFSIL